MDIPVEFPESGMATPLLPGGNAIFTMEMAWKIQWKKWQVVWQLHFYQVVMPFLPWKWHGKSSGKSGKWYGISDFTRW